MQTEEASKQANMRTEEACEEKGKSINSNRPKIVPCISLQARGPGKVL